MTQNVSFLEKSIPAFLAVTLPFELTVAMDGLLEDHFAVTSKPVTYLLVSLDPHAVGKKTSFYFDYQKEH